MLILGSWCTSKKLANDLQTSLSQCKSEGNCEKKKWNCVNVKGEKVLPCNMKTWWNTKACKRGWTWLAFSQFHEVAWMHLEGTPVFMWTHTHCNTHLTNHCEKWIISSLHHYQAFLKVSWRCVNLFESSMCFMWSRAHFLWLLNVRSESALSFPRNQPFHNVYANLSITILLDVLVTESERKEKN